MQSEKLLIDWDAAVKCPSIGLGLALFLQRGRGEKRVR